MVVPVAQLEVGDAMPVLETEPVRLQHLVRYSGASGDFNPIHHDDQFARSVGLDGVIAHGMYVMGLMGTGITRWVGVAAVRNFQVRFVGMTRLGERLNVTGKVIEKFEQDGRTTVRCEVTATGDGDEPKAVGSFVAAG